MLTFIILLILLSWTGFLPFPHQSHNLAEQLPKVASLARALGGYFYKLPPWLLSLLALFFIEYAFIDIFKVGISSSLWSMFMLSSFSIFTLFSFSQFFVVSSFVSSFLSSSCCFFGSFCLLLEHCCHKRLFVVHPICVLALSWLLFLDWFWLR